MVYEAYNEIRNSAANYLETLNELIKVKIPPENEKIEEGNIKNCEFFFFEYSETSLIRTQENPVPDYFSLIKSVPNTCTCYDLVCNDPESLWLTRFDCTQQKRILKFLDHFFFSAYQV